VDIQTGGKSPGQAEAETGKPPKRVEFVGAPIPVINPTVGNGLAGVAAIAVHLNPKDKKSPPSLFGGGAVFTSNGTRAWGVLSKLHLKEDRFRILGAFGDGRIKYDYYGIGLVENNRFIPLSLDAFAFKVRLFERWYAGPRYHMVRSNVSLNLDRFNDEFPGETDPLIDVPKRDFKVQSAALGLRAQRDSRESQFCPRTGSFFDTTLDFYDPAFASDRNCQNVEVVYH